jgi:UDP-N-acetylglucosamine diphosphorylase / glucose-1-phosphate thymidylyltransferase / UDP-N-acetylgalactosamine diphosphorylase / glucosamine-1-phosphate N-acetyltransferase / galactosamine-1-phosphate N-acetyltransferase
MINIIIPMVGEGKRFVDYGFKINKFLLPIDKDLTPMIEKAITTLDMTGQFIFIIREEGGIINSSLRTLLTKIYPTCIILSVDKLTEGPASSAYIAKNYIDNDNPLIISNSDQILDYNSDLFLKTCSQYDGCVMTYTPDYEVKIGSKDKHSFIKLDENGYGIQLEEKIAISNCALVGTHYYKRGKDFARAYEYIVQNNIRAPNGEFYISNTYQAMILMGYKIGIYHLGDNEKFHPVGEPKDYFKFYNVQCPIKNSFPLPDDISIITLEKESIVLSNCLVKVIQGSINCIYDIFTTGERLEIKAYENAKILIVKNIVEPFHEINLSKYMRGWVLGEFEPSLKKTKYEVGFLHHEKGQQWPYHYHKNSDEINILCQGQMIINDCVISQGDLFVFEKNVISCPQFLQDCDIICIKTVSDKNDKHII